MSEDRTDIMEQPPRSEALLEAILSQADDVAVKGFDLLEQHTAQDLQSEEDMAGLQQAVDKVYQKIQENVYVSLTRWAEFCDSLFSVAEDKMEPVKVAKSAASIDAETLAANGSELRQELSYWCSRLVAAEQKCAELKRETKNLEMSKRACQQVGKLLTAGDPSHRSKMLEAFEDVERACKLIMDEHEKMETETPASKMRARAI